MKISILIIFVFVSIASTGQDMITIQCTDHYSGNAIKASQINSSKISMEKSDGRILSLGEVIDGKFEIRADYNLGDEITISVEEGRYLSDTHSCARIEKKGFKFALYPERYYAKILTNERSLNTSTFTNNNAKLASIAFLNNEIAYINKDTDQEIYNEASKKIYTSLGKIFNLNNAIDYDEKQSRWVPSTELNDAIIAYKKNNGFEDINAQIDINFLSQFSGLKSGYVIKTPEEIYEITKINGGYIDITNDF